MVLESPVIFHDICCQRFYLNQFRVEIDRNGNIGEPVRKIRNIHRARNDDFRRFRHIIVIYVPIYVVGVLVEYKCQFVMGVAFGIEVVLHILAEHTTIDYIAVRRTLSRFVHIIARYLDIRSVRDIVLALVILVLMLIIMLALHVLEEKQ